MRSLLGRFHRPFARSADEQLLLLNNLGDGSTLSLDFTTGVLDPRLNFTRGTNATFINSQGLVQWANSNMFRNTVWTSTSLPTGWLANPSNTGTITYNGDGTISCNASSQTAWIYPNFPYVETANGLSYICSVRVVSISAPAAVNAIVSSGNLTALEYFIDGVSKLASDSVTGPCVVSVRVTASGTQWYPRLGAGVQGVNVSFNLVMSEPHAHPGVAPRAYMANTSTSAANFNTPRFDYDPTAIGTPRGLLIEGSAVNLAPYSNLQAAWAGGTNTTPTPNTTEVLSPDGTNNATKIALGSASYCSRFESITGLAASTAYTFSYWIRGTAGNQQRVYSVTAGADLIAQTTLSYSTSGWTRVQINFTTTAAVSNVYIYVVSRPTGTASDVIYVWGVQLEAGTGASSLIPTGASTGNRAYDHCYATGANFTSWFSVGAGTMVAVSDNIKNNVQNLAATISDDSTSNYVRMGFKVGGASNEYLLTTVGGPSSFQGATDSGYAPPRNTVYRMAYAWDTNNFGIVANGGAVVTDSSGTVAGAGVLTRLVVGGDFVSVPNDIYFKNGHIQSLKYWPTRLPNAQLQALTT